MIIEDLKHIQQLYVPTPRLLIRLRVVEGILGFREREHIPFQWPCVSLVPRGTQDQTIRFVRQRFDHPTLDTNKQTYVPTKKGWLLILDQNKLNFYHYHAIFLC